MLQIFVLRQCTVFKINRSAATVPCNKNQSTPSFDDETKFVFQFLTFLLLQAQDDQILMHLHINCHRARITTLIFWLRFKKVIPINIKRFLHQTKLNLRETFPPSIVISKLNGFHPSFARIKFQCSPQFFHSRTVIPNYKQQKLHLSTTTVSITFSRRFRKRCREFLMEK